MKKRHRAVSFMISFLAGASLFCGGSGGGNNSDENGGETDQTRAFYMGFSPWPYDNTQSAVDQVYAGIRQNGDIISQHIEEGVPWQESYDSTAFAADFVNTINYRVTNSAGRKIVLQINPLNGARDGMAPYRGSSTNSPLPAAWRGLALNDPKVMTAYLNYVERMVDYFNPDYLLIGVEVNLVIRNNPSIWSDYLALHRYVYGELKKKHPSLPVGVSVFCVPFFPEWSGADDGNAQSTGVAELEPYVDFIAFSVHPFMSGLLADDFPDDYMRRLFSVTSKPVAISESSYPAEEWTTMSAPVLTFRGTPAKQERFLSLMLDECQRSKAFFAIWYAIRDYDALWNAFDAATKATAITWRDTGLLDEAGNERQAMAIWKNRFSRSVSR